MKPFNIDHDRQRRLGFPEIIYGTHKTAEVLIELLQAYAARGENALITKLQPEKAERLLALFPTAFFEKDAGIFELRFQEANLKKGEVAILSGGTSDLFVVNEAYYTLRHLGLEAERVIDVGVSGIHRLMNKLPGLSTFKVLIVVAGFEGTLPTVVGGLLAQPIIAVPTDVGYGVAADGYTALHTMLASCANGISVVNINNGYGAAMAAYRILRNIHAK